MLEAIEILDRSITNPSEGLPQEAFLFISRTTPLVNVDLLIRDDLGRTLLAWRDDQYAGKGWHIPGGIVRYKEKLQTRLIKTAESELGTTVDFDPVPVAVNEIICDHRNRGHFISILFRCRAPKDFSPANTGRSEGDRGYLMWHDACPSNLIKVHEIYRRHMA